MTTWEQELEEERRNVGDTSPIVALAPDDPEVWRRSFYDGYGGTEGEPVLAWSETRVYFPVCYDGAESMGSAPRYPRPEGQDHVGG